MNSVAADSAEQRAANGGDGQTPVTAADIAAQVGGRLVGDGTVSLFGVAPLDRAREQDLSFLTHARYTAWFTDSRAAAVIMSPQFEPVVGRPAVRIIVDKPMDAMVSVLARFHRREPRAVGVHATAVVSASASIGAGVTIDPYAVIGDDVVIGDGCWIGANAVVGAGSVLGRDVRLHAQATVYPYTELGDRVVLCSGARVGREGFGFVPQANGPVRIPHSGRCILEHDVEIGANSCVDRGSVDDTIIGAGTKIDNLVQIAHNVRVGRMCFFASQAGVAGSTRIEDGVQIGGQVGLGGHLTIGSRATVAAQAGVFGDIPGGELWSGYPARPHKEALRSQAALHRLAKIIRPIEQLLKGESNP
ncbi:UDP-3-O-[3-hydroxymyristoyl] glucosamine N-acyltransferase [Gemmatimonas aurantiaca T-27]|uniref:UDP-3-O-acylglucosamine N-acyltransferase n=1 Tax=Gemmatimonas aurantiaca (strain DSM 14586 / JCM 11422 / NBRC 100505 / T-27) TaxID=379066 RepID=C1A8R9_GEMAT|nr:UDP-3-O-[3-hydroxymyristoyl] glucosamine N-acyltransferase [Gemmatimonas aurantiaca T-27]